MRPAAVDPAVEPARVAAGRRGSLGGLIRLGHPFPSLLDGLVTVALAVVAGGSVAASRASSGWRWSRCRSRSARSTTSSTSIATAVASPASPSPPGSSVGGRPVVVVVGGLGRRPGPVGDRRVRRPLVVAVAGVATGYAYDLRLKADRLGLAAVRDRAAAPAGLRLGRARLGRVPAAFVVLIPLAVAGRGRGRPAQRPRRRRSGPGGRDSRPRRSGSDDDGSRRLAAGLLGRRRGRGRRVARWRSARTPRAWARQPRRCRL